MRLLFPVVALLALVGLVVPSWAEEPWATREAVILARVLAYDRNLESRVGSAVIVVVLRKSRGEGGEDAHRVFESFQTLQKLTIRGLPLSVAEIEYRGIEDLDAAIRRLSAGAVYLGPSLERELGDILRVTRGHRVLTMASTKVYLSMGAAVGVFEEGGKARIHVNLPASRGEGVALLPELLRLAEVTR